mmetsp:Transcript_7259/g.16037  ORF Transcript_7259/g.16037 Transcript_7259/m.16037 type:complete len:500 (+) Transcript_7259:149-1648(+)
MSTTLENEEKVAELMHRIQMHVMPRRVRCLEFFSDFDHVRHGRCSEVNFARALGTMGLNFSEDETRLLAEHFTQFGPNVIRPAVVNYRQFCSEVDQIFSDEDAQENMKSMTLSSSPGFTVMSTFQPNNIEDEERFLHVLHRVAALCKSRGVAIKPIYVDYDRSSAPSPSMLNTRRGGKVTKEQFVRGFPFKKEMSEADIELICEKYATPAGDVHFMALHNDVAEVLPDPAQPFPTSPLYLRPDCTEWSRNETPVVARIQAKVVEKRVRLKDTFQDFDPLRKGFCTPGQLKAAFTILNLSREIDRNDFENLMSIYLSDDGLFNYQAFIDDVDRAFTQPGLEREPLTVIDMPGPQHTIAARRDPMRLTASKLSKIGYLEDKIRTFVTKRRCEMKPMFQDFDRCHKGYITRTQFARIMSSMGMDLDEMAIAYLCNRYCDLGNHTDINWKKFLATVDPPPMDVETAMNELTSPFIAFKPRPYFDTRGKVISKSRSSPMLTKVM